MQVAIVFILFPPFLKIFIPKAKRLFGQIKKREQRKPAGITGVRNHSRFGAVSP